MEVRSQPLELWVIYFDPSDYPGMYVTRRFSLWCGEPFPDPSPLAVTTSLAAARAVVPIDCVCFQRDEEDEPQVVETWI